MPQVCRVGDIGVGTCSAHSSTKSVTVTINTGANTVVSEGAATATIVSIGISSCGHTSAVVGFSATVRAEGGGVHRVGDIGVLPGGTYSMIQGAATVFAGG